MAEVRSESTKIESSTKIATNNILDTFYSDLFNIAQSLINQKTTTVQNSTRLISVLDFFCEFNESKYSTVDQDKLIFTPGKLVQFTQHIKCEEITAVVHILLLIGYFMTEDIEIEIEGVTNRPNTDNSALTASVDLFKLTHWMIFRLFFIKGFDLTIKRRGFYPDGNGLVCLKMKNGINQKDLRMKRSDFHGFEHSYQNIKFTKMEKIEKIRGLVISSRIGSDYVARMSRVIKEVCGKKVKNTKVMSIVNNKNDSGPSPGYECSIFGETKSGIFYSSRMGETDDKPEELTNQVIEEMFDSIKSELVIDNKLLNTIFFLMANGVGVGQIICKNPPEGFLEKIKEWFGVDYKIDKTDKYSLVSVIGKY